MTKVILDIPTDKIKPFMNMVIKLGIEKNAVRSNFDKADNGFSFKQINALISKYLLFDWEFYNNELEFE